MMAVVWATAHVTQFSQVGWRYLDKQHGSGYLAAGGFYTTLVDPASSNFTLQVVKISHDHAACTRPKLPDFNVSAEQVTFQLDASMPPAPGNRLAVWKSNFEAETALLFERQRDISVAAGGTFTLDVEVGDFYTISTVMTATKGQPKHPVPASVPQFPLPHKDAFDK
jgi:galactosylceramidase